MTSVELMNNLADFLREVVKDRGKGKFYLRTCNRVGG